MKKAKRGLGISLVGKVRTSLLLGIVICPSILNPVSEGAAYTCTGKSYGLANIQDQLEEGTRKKLEDLLKQLDSDDPLVRESTQKDLEGFLDNGAKAEFMKKMSAKCSTEVKERVNRVMRAYQLKKSGRIAFIRKGDIWMIDFDGSNEQRLTDTGQVVTYNSSVFGPLLWSPDAKSITFKLADGNGWYNYCVIDVENKKVVQLTDGADRYENLAWSPDGTSLAFVRYVSGSRWDLYAVEASGKNLKRLAEEISPAFSWLPNKSIIFTKTVSVKRDGGWTSETYIYHVDVSGKNVVDPKLWKGGSTYVSPDGKKLAFTMYKDGIYDLYVKDMDSGNEEHLLAHMQVPQRGYRFWSPDSRKILVEVYKDKVWKSCIVSTDKKIKHLDCSSVHSVYWSLNGKVLSLFSPEISPSDLSIFGHILIFDVAKETVEKKISLENNFQFEGASFTLSPDGKNIAFVKFDLRKSDGLPMASELILLDIDAKTEQVIIKKGPPIYCPIRSPSLIK